MKTKLLVVVVCALAMGCAPEEGGGTSPNAGSLELAPEPASAPSSPDGGGQPPPGHGGPNPGWGGAPPPGRGHDTPPGHLGDAGTPIWKHEDAPRIISSSQSRTRVQPGDTVAFQIVATDPNGLALTYTWSATQGHLHSLTSPAGNEGVWTAPFINSQVTVTVRVENTLGLAATKTFRVQADADLSTAVFVSPNGSDSNSGSTTSPYATVQQAIRAAAASGKTHVVLAAGTYREALQLPSNISLWGQYDPATWDHVPANATTLASPTHVGLFVSDAVPASLGAASDEAQAQCVYNYAASGFIFGLRITSSDASREQSSVAVLLNNVSGTFTIVRSTLEAGAGGDGIPAALRGDACGGAGGGWGMAGQPGCAADTGAPGGAPGQGGATWGAWGTGGGDGSDGINGIVPLNQNVGQLSGSTCVNPGTFNWQALGGSNGTGGSGGGGGGGGVVGICCLPTWPPKCSAWPAGVGGHGGVGGRGGNGGSGAGGSFGLVILNSTGTVAAQYNVIATSAGGMGGAGGSAHSGTAGQAGQPGAFCFAGSGGNGGNGGRGGNGGGGAGGGGGMSVGILRHNSPNLDVGVPDDTNIYSLDAPGAGGQGGWPAPAGMPGILSPTFVIP